VKIGTSSNKKPAVQSKKSRNHRRRLRYNHPDLNPHYLFNLDYDATNGGTSAFAAAVTTGSTLDLHPGALSTIAGRSLQITSDTVIKSVWTGDGNDIIIANDFGDTIQGGRGNDTIVAGAGADKLYGGPGSDTFVFNALGKAAATVCDFAVGA